MNAAAKTILVLVILVVAVIGVMLASGDPGEAPIQRPTAVAAPEPEQEETPASMVATPDRQEPTAVQRREVVQAKAPEEFSQGVRGRILDPTGAVPPSAKVYLVEAPGTDVFKQLMLVNKGIRNPPLARGTTDEAGRFALGLEVADASKRYEVRIVTDDYVDAQVPPITIKPSQWYDTGDIVLQLGTTLWGRVTIAGSGGMPVPNATVFIQPANFFPSISPTPGREEGIPVKVDHTGTFRTQNAPPGPVTVGAVAPDYARLEKQNVNLEANSENQVMFELQPGVSIGGLVVDATGTAIGGAKVEATAISNKAPARGTSHSSQDGSFEIIGLLDGPYMVTAIAPGYVRAELKPIQAGDRELQVVLERQGEAKIRVFDKNGRVMSRFLLTVKTYYEGQDHYGNTDIPPKQAKTGKDGTATVGGLDPASYVFQVEAKNHCKAFSEPFQIVQGQDAPTVEVRLTEGGVLEGTVTSSRGQPLANVQVSTLPNHLDENPFTQMFQGLIPFKITRQSARTDAKGRYRFALLNPGSYQLKFAHAEYFEVYSKNNVVEDGRTVSIPPMVMEPGTIFTGQVRVDGSTAAQVKVTISSIADPDTPAAGGVFNCEAITDNEGNFAMSKRAPPGRYQVMAARQTLGNPLLQIADFHRTRQEVTFGRGQEKFFLPLAISSN
ncbi:MAG: carboxypeptidase-like regulatory domain-containing protein [Planctomycetota bacterium]